MISIKPKYLFDSKGKKEYVLLRIHDFDKMLEEIEELEDTKAAISAKKDKNSDFISLEELKKGYYSNHA